MRIWLMARIARRLTNWKGVWRGYVEEQPIPELHFRSGLRLSHSPGDAPVLLLLEVFADGCYRRHLREPLTGTVLDIGANIGATALDFAWRHPGLEIHCYEPNPRSCGMLRHNVLTNRLERGILIRDVAVGRGPGFMRLNVAAPSIAATAYGHSLSDGAIEVPCIGLEECVARVTKPPVALLKVDAEGAEADILEGAPCEIWTQVRHVALEYHNDLCPDADERCLTVLRRERFKTRRTIAEPGRGLIHAWR